MNKVAKVALGFIVAVVFGFGGVVAYSNAMRGEFVAELAKTPNFAQRQGIYFRVVKFGFIDVVGEFREFRAQGSATNGAITRLSGEISAESVDSQSEKRDEIVRGEKLLNVAQNPRIHFEMKEFVALDEGQKGTQNQPYAVVVGNLTLNGVSKEVALQAWVQPSVADLASTDLGVQSSADSGENLGDMIVLSGRINVKDFGISNFPVVSDFVDIVARFSLP